MTTHEVLLELSSGSRVLIGSELEDIPAANVIATRWKALAEERPNELHETMPGSGVAVRGAAIVAIKAQLTPKAGTMAGMLKVPRDGSWL